MIANNLSNNKILDQLQPFLNLVLDYQVFAIFISKRAANILKFLKEKTKKVDTLNNLTKAFTSILSKATNDKKSTFSDIELVLRALYPEIMNVKFRKALIMKLVDEINLIKETSNLSMHINVDQEILFFKNELEVRGILNIIKDYRELLIFLYSVLSKLNPRYVSKTLLGIPPKRTGEVIKSIEKKLKTESNKSIEKQVKMPNYSYPSNKNISEHEDSKFLSIITLLSAPTGGIYRSVMPKKSNTLLHQQNLDNTKINSSYKDNSLKFLTWISILAATSLLILLALLETEIVYYGNDAPFFIEVNSSSLNEGKITLSTLQNLFNYISEFNTHRRVWLFNYKVKGNKRRPQEAIICVDLVNEEGKVIETKTLSGSALIIDFFNGLCSSLIDKKDVTVPLNKVLKDVKMYKVKMSNDSTLEITEKNNVEKLKDLLLDTMTSNCPKKSYIVEVEMKNGEVVYLELNWILSDFLSILGF